jgi:hypothetical protein
MTIDLTALLASLEAAKADAFRVYEANKASGSGGESTAFDSGRYDGLKQAIAIVDALAR